MKKLTFSLPLLMMLALTGAATAEKSGVTIVAVTSASYGIPQQRVQFSPAAKRAVKISMDVAGRDAVTGPTYIWYSNLNDSSIYKKADGASFVKIMEKAGKIMVSAPASTAADAEKAVLGKELSRGTDLGIRPPKK